MNHGRAESRLRLVVSPALKLNIVEIGGLPLYNQDLGTANHHLRQSLVFFDVPTLQQPEVYLGGVANLVDAEGNITNESTRAFLTKFTNSFAHWIEVQRRQP